MKRFLSLCLVLCLILSALPVVSFAKKASAAPSASAVPKSGSTFKPTCTGEGAKTVKLTWKAVSGATKYTVWRRPENGNYDDYVRVAKTTSLTYTDKKAKKGEINYYIIMADTPSGWVQSKQVGCYPLTPPTVTAKKTGASEAVLSWEKVSGASQYEIQYAKKKNGTYKKVATVGKSTLTWTYSGSLSSSACFRIRAVRKDGSRSAYTVAAPKNTVSHALHTLFVFEEEFPVYTGNSPMRTSGGDMPLWRAMLGKGTPKGYPWKSWGGSKEHVCKNLSASQLESKINALAKATTDNDVFLFYLSTHGYSGESTGEYAGELNFSDGSFMTIGKLASLLKKVPGKGVIVLTSCGSGAAISKSGEADSSAAADAEFTRKVVAAFRGADVEVISEDDSADAKSGEMIDKKFCVICAAQAGSDGIYAIDSHTWLTQWMADGVFGADSNNDRVVTISEMSSYVKRIAKNNPFNLVGQYGLYYLTPVTYCANPNFPLFK